LFVWNKSDKYFYYLCFYKLSYSNFIILEIFGTLFMHNSWINVYLYFFVYNFCLNFCLFYLYYLYILLLQYIFSWKIKVPKCIVASKLFFKMSFNKSSSLVQPIVTSTSTFFKTCLIFLVIIATLQKYQLLIPHC